MKICYVYCQPLKSLRKGYSEQHPIRLAKIMGDQAQIYVLYSGTLDEELLTKNQVISIPIPSRWMTKGLVPRIAALVYYTYKLGKKYKFDIYINVWAHYMAFPLWLGGKIAGIKTAASVGGVPIKKKLYRGKRIGDIFRKAFGLSLEWFSLKVVPKIHTVAFHLKKEFSSRGIPSDKFTVISRGIDTSAFPNTISQKINESTNEEYHIVTVCSLSPLKGVETIIDAFDRVAENFPGMHLHIVGGGDYQQTLEMYAGEKKSKGNIIFYGFLDHTEVANLYARMHLFVLASHSEGIANVILEAMLCGLIVAGSAVGDIPVHLAESRGFLFEVGDTDALTEIISRVVTTPWQDFLTMKQKARKYVLENHSFQVVKDRYIDFFLQLIGSKR
jgi:glycosyltransferase involved in cell wall biosynthesis